MVITAFNPSLLISSSEAAFDNQPRPPCFFGLRPFGSRWWGWGWGGSACMLQCLEFTPCVQTKGYSGVKTHASKAHGG